jgi:hypothetical protein
MNRRKRPGDFAQLAKLIVDIATGQVPPDPPIAPESARAKVGCKGADAQERIAAFTARKRSGPR